MIMKTYKHHIIPALLVILSACQREAVPADENHPSGEPVVLSVSIDQETKVTVNDSYGTIAFSSGDAIKVFDGSAVYSGTTSSSSVNGTFLMEPGFNSYGTGYVGYPAALVSNITSDGVVFSLPASYEYAEVGGNNANQAKVPYPMVGVYSSDGDGTIQLKAACSLMRFRITNVASGSITFSFPSHITGTTTAIATPSGTLDGILADNLSDAGMEITVTDVPAVASGSYIYITLPVPTGTLPGSIIVTNIPSDSYGVRIDGIESSLFGLQRAEGHQFGLSLIELPASSFRVSDTKSVSLAPGNLMAHIGSYSSPVATADQWKFGNPLEAVGVAATDGNYLLANDDPAVVGKWVDMLIWQGSSCTNRAQGLVYTLTNDETFVGNVSEEPLYEGCWSTHNNNENPATGDYIHIANGGAFDWRPLSVDEWDYLVNSENRGAVVNGVSGVRHVRATLADVNGVLFFPDTDEEIWNSTTMGTPPEGVNYAEPHYRLWGSYNTYSASNALAMFQAGIVFMPTNGYRAGSFLPSSGPDMGAYWSATSYDAEKAYIFSFYIQSFFAGNHDNQRGKGMNVRLARDLE